MFIKTLENHQEVLAFRVHPNCLAHTRDVILKLVVICAAWLRLAQYRNAWISGSSCPMDPCRGLRVTQNAYFSLLTHTKKLLLVTFCDLTAETGVGFGTHGAGIGNGNGQMDSIHVDVQNLGREL